MKVLITGVAGFIGSHLARYLIGNGNHVIGIDNLNNYYDQSLKSYRLNLLTNHANSEKFHFFKEDISDRAFMEKLFAKNNFDVVVNLAAQAGVRHSIVDPYSYLNSNLAGFLNILEGCRHLNIKHLIYASSSSVYGMNVKQPSSIEDQVDAPISFYAATKKSNELMAYSYSHLFKIPMTGLRFFTVYGPHGRPDMAYYKFTKAILNGSNIDVYNHGKMQRDFTYIDDVIDGIARVIDLPPSSSPSKITTATAPHRLYNIGNNSPVSLREFISTIESACGRHANKTFLPMQPGDVNSTYADIDDFSRDTGFRPKKPLSEGIKDFVDWYKEYYEIVD
jgi:UDP-glucuronate 4-epimerase